MKLFKIKHFYLDKNQQIVKTMIQYRKQDVKFITVSQRWLYKDKAKWVKTGKVYFEVVTDNNSKLEKPKVQDGFLHTVEYFQVLPIKKTGE